MGLILGGRMVSYVWDNAVLDRGMCDFDRVVLLARELNGLMEILHPLTKTPKKQNRATRIHPAIAKLLRVV